MAEPHELEIGELAALLRARAVSPVELCLHFIERVERYDRLVNAFINWDPLPVLEQARRAETRLRDRGATGPLDGVPIAVKDNMATTGLPTTVGSRAPLPIDGGDAAAVSALRAGGAIVFGKTNLPELAYGPTDRYVFGPTRNPWDLGRYSGGSSMGAAAAVAAGLVPGALGTDTTGSVRHPANWCGVTGLKPTRDRIPLTGVVPLARSLDHVGVLGRSARDCRLLLVATQVVAPRPLPRSPPARIGLVRAPCWERLAEPVRAAVGEAVEVLRALGVSVVEVPLPRWGLVADAAEIVLAREAAEGYGTILELGAGARRKLDDAIKVSHRQYELAQQLASEFRADLEQAMAGTDVLLTPGRESTAPRMDEAGRLLDDPAGVRCAAPLNLAGWPALSVPCGFDPQGLPIGLQLVARPGEDEALLQMAELYQEATNWHRRRPDL
ncbi:Asp-tRNA(Asn)/Glu-tRNA(Gln) amidotransferase subunit GatA [Pseudonocardia eucalypti]|uniref:Asp-tRNA(Asn)/Glu-tRNA(Gln) amidotransferase subunit GatA n=1 Tax=Pseudonocardia eucalypti TaxID=648755 RepID=A0ABP9QIJ2_9PSEU|nr:aspartyl-tRNA(Asn)/glutamyl-tRNA(Gln) amidotransferase subunit A [Pseudonocardia eucalypti]